MSSETAWVELQPSHHFVSTDDRGRRCGLCHKIIPAGEKYYASWKLDFSGAVRFHVKCAEKYAQAVFK